MDSEGSLRSTTNLCIDEKSLQETASTSGDVRLQSAISEPCVADAAKHEITSPQQLGYTNLSFVGSTVGDSKLGMEDVSTNLLEKGKKQDYDSMSTVSLSAIKPQSSDASHSTSRLSYFSGFTKSSNTRQELLASAPDLLAIDDSENNQGGAIQVVEADDVESGFMAIIVKLKNLTVIGGKQCKRYCKIVFRDKPQKSKLTPGEEVTQFNQTFKWPLGRGVDANDQMIVKVYTKLITSSLIGILNISLEALAKAPNGRLELSESLVDENHLMLDATLELDITYHRPDMNKYMSTADDKLLLEEAGVTKSKRDLASKLKNIVRHDSQSGDHGRDSFGEADIREQVLNAGRHCELKYLARFDPTIHLAEDFQLQLTIVEARQLNGMNINPYVEIIIGEEAKRTEVQIGTNSPSFNEYFCFDFKMPRSQVLDQVLQLRVYNKSTSALAKLLRGKLIGEFRVDLRTVWDSPDHMIFNKWTQLVDPHDACAGSRGYVKIQAHLVARSEESKPHAPQPFDPNKSPDTQEEIEANLISSSLSNNAAMQKRQLAEISVKIYKAQDLPRMSTDIVSSLHQAILRSDKPMLDPLVAVTYGGLTAETRKKKATYNPVWNEELVFTDLFPPLCQRIRISVMDETIVGKNECIATHYIDLAQVMNGSQSGFLPTFGPSWINLYGCPRQYQYEHWLGHDEELNLGLGEGASYRGRMLIAVKTKLLNEAQHIEAKTRATPALGENALGIAEDFVLFCSVYEAGVIDAEIGSKKTPLRFELSCGMNGNVIDAAAVPNAEVNVTDKSYSEGMEAQTNDNIYYHLPIGSHKPCMFVKVRSEDNRPRMLIANALSRLIDYLEVCTEELLSNLKDLRLEEVIRHLKNSAAKFANYVAAVTRNFEELKGIGVRTHLDKERHRTMLITLEKLKVKAKQIRLAEYDPEDRESIYHRVKELKSIIPIIQELIIEPQHTIPDVFLWLLAGDQRLAYARVATRDILYAEREEQKGSRCGKVTTLIMRKPGRRGTGKSGWAMQAKLKVYFWMGLTKYLNKLKDGLPPTYQLADDKVDIPREIVYQNMSTFQLRAYLYLARNLIGSDETGLSDPFARIIMRDKVVTSRVVNETLNPIWDQTLVLEGLTFFSCVNWVREHDTIVVVEIFDHDDDGSSEFLGRSLVTAVPILHHDMHYEIPSLKWHNVYRNQKPAGKLLAAFELIEQKDGEQQFPSCYPSEMISLASSGSQDQERNADNDKSSHGEDFIVPIPKQIRPVLAKYRLQVLFWGVRNMKKVQFRAVNSPRVELEWSRYIVKSKKIQNATRCPNFSEPVAYLDLELPENPVYWSPITIRCFESRDFGRQIFIGSHVISNLIKYIRRDEPPPDTNANEGKKGKRRGRLGNLLSAGAHKKTRDTSADKKGAEIEAEAAVNNETAPHIVITEDAPQENDGVFEAADGSKPPGGESRGEKRLDSFIESFSESIQLNRDEVDEQHTSAPAEVGIEPEAAEEVDVTSTMPVKGKKPGGALPTEALQFAMASDKPDDWELAELDWWSQYYASLELAQESVDGMLEGTGGTEAEDNGENVEAISVVTADRLLDGIEVDVGPMDDMVTLEAPDGVSKLKKRRKRRRRLMGKQEEIKRRAAARKSAAQYQNEVFAEDDDQKMRDANDVKNWIQKLTVYSCPLELVPDFGGFTALLQTYPLLRGKASDEDGDDDAQECVGALKGNLSIFRIYGPETLLTPPRLPSNQCRDVLVRVYVVRALDLAPTDTNGKSDPYVIVRLGATKELNDRDHYVPCELNPLFGRCFEFHAVFPQESELTVAVMDMDLLSGDDEIGQTKIDLENRLLSKHYATCGLPSAYEMTGYNKWRDMHTPVQILSRLCNQNQLPSPVYDPVNYRVFIGENMFYGPNYVQDESGKLKPSNEPLALSALRQLHQVEGGPKLVPQHVERRPLFSHERPGIEQGRIEMWVDLFSKDLGVPPPPIDISPREPKKFQLRVTIWNTDEVVLNDTSMLTGEKSSDIYVKGWLNGADIDMQSTDIHYRSMTGEGNFNWRFIFNFGYMPAEDRIVVKKKENALSLDETTYKKHPILFVQLWDADLIGSDNFLGTLELRITKFPRPSKVAKSCGLHQFDKHVPQMNILKHKRCKGWWPFSNKSDDTNEDIVTGKLEAELHLVTAEEAETSPVGLAREEPEPLPPPNRPEVSFFNFLNPLKIIKHLLFTYKWIIIQVLLVFLVTLFIFLLFYTSPAAITQKIIGR